MEICEAVMILKQKFITLNTLDQALGEFVSPMRLIFVNLDRI